MEYSATDLISRRGILFVFSSPSGGGKSTLSKKLIESVENLKPSISATTREPREGERDGIDYFFLSSDKFDNLIKEDGFLEYTTIYQNKYGTPKSYVLDSINNGRDLIFNVDLKGAKAIKEQFPEDTVTLFILPPSMKVLKERILGRNANTEADLQIRLEAAKSEIESHTFYDYTVINDSIEQSLHQLKTIVEAEKSKTRRLNLKNFIEANF